MRCSFPESLSVLLGLLAVPCFGQTPLGIERGTTQHQGKTLPRQSVGKTERTLDIPAAAKKVVSVLVSGINGKPDGQGSGFFIDSHGTLITNHHVIKDAASAVVKTTDGAYYLVEGVLADDPEHDLTLLKVSGHNFGFLPLGDSAKVQLGERVIAIGNPLGLESTVSDGIVSGLRGEGDAEVIQTTAPISPGSSGGVLLNSRGQVIGVTTFLVVDGQNLNFAIPSNNIRPLLTLTSLRPFIPAPPPLAKRYEAPKAKEVKPSLPNTATDLPRDWIRAEDDTPATLSQQGDLLHLEGQIRRGDLLTCNAKQGDVAQHTGRCAIGEYWVVTSYGGYCAHATRPNPHDWTGQCTYGVYSQPTICFVNLTMRISSLSSHKIEGTVQGMVSGLGVCPHPSSEIDSFTLIPK